MGPIEIIAASFEGENRAQQVLDELQVMDKDDTLSILNAVVVRKDAQGNVSATDDGDLRAGGGALFGALVGAVVGLLGGPGGAVIGAAAGAITGGITAAGIDLGFDDNTITEMQRSLQPGSSMILALVEPEWTERVSADIEGRRGKVIHQALRSEFISRYQRDEWKRRNKD